MKLSSLMHCFGIVLLLLVPSTSLASSNTTDSSPFVLDSISPSAATPLNLEKFIGRWHVIARIPNPVERGHVGSMREYRRDSDDNIQIHYLYRDKLDGPLKEDVLRATPDGESGHRHWRIWFYKIVPTRSEILEFDPHYQWVLVRYPGRGLAWILGKNPSMDQATYYLLLSRLAEHGIHTDRMRRVVHFPDQVNRLGFETP